MAFIAETVVGATAGAVPPVAGYFKRIREICDQYGVLLILDEVMCGMGRTGTLFASEQEGISPDIVTIAKGLGAGYQPIGAMLCSGKIFAAIRDGSGFFQHGHTYLGHSMAAAGSLAVLETLLEDNLLGQVRVKGERLNDALRHALGDHPNVGNIRGRGLFRGIELVQDRNSKAPFDSSHEIHKQIKAAAFDRGLLCYPMGGTLDGLRGDHILVAPPFIITDDEIDYMVGLLKSAVQSILPHRNTG
jgi:adenosylmethionine-8-amino-7-oxononanoate aminotransferase